MATSTCAGLLDATISLNRGIQQLFPSAAIARRMLPTVFAVLRRRRHGSKTDKTSEIAVIAQCTLQPLRRPVHVTEFAATAQRNDFRQRFQHVAETFDLDPQAVTARRAQGFQTPSLADQPLAPAVEFTRAIGFRRSASLRRAQHANHGPCLIQPASVAIRRCSRAERRQRTSRR